jgi:tRNA modification GTPase
MEKIVALSTPFGRGAIAVLRFSGEGVKEKLKKYFSPFPDDANKILAGKFNINGITDSAMLVYFDAPKSYTGEEMAELHIHGSPMLIKTAMEKFLSDGFCMAQNGEFTKRAFLNGKTDLARSEGLIDLIDAESQSALKAASDLAQNKLGKKIKSIQNELTDISASLEATLDYPEEDLEGAQLPDIEKKLQNVLGQLETLLKTAKDGKTAKYGINIAIVGDVNVGKSSLLNALAGFDRVIVSPEEGTTRDTVTESISYKGLRFNLTDTAGMRETENEIEKIGISRAKKALEEADLVIYVIDRPFIPKEYEEIKKPKLLVFNKTDKNCRFEKADVNLSAKEGANIELLKEIIFNKFNGEGILSADILLTSSRHVSCIKQAFDAVKGATENLYSVTMDIIASQVYQAWLSLGQITGDTDTQIVIDEIFSKFCLGK